MDNFTLQPQQRPPNAQLKWLKDALRLVGRTPLQHGILYLVTLLLAYGASIFSTTPPASMARFVATSIVVLVIFCVYVFCGIAIAGHSDRRARKIENTQSQRNELLYLSGYAIGALLLVMVSGYVFHLIAPNLAGFNLVETLGFQPATVIWVTLGELIIANYALFFVFFFLKAWFTFCLLIFTLKNRGHARQSSADGTRLNIVSISKLFLVMAIANTIPFLGILYIAILPAWLYVAFRDIFLHQSENAPAEAKERLHAQESPAA